MEILATLHPDNNPNDNLFPNVKKENIPSKAINLDKLSDEVKNKLPKVISSDTLLPATKLKYLEIDGVTYYIPQRVDVTSNIKITGNVSDILSSPKNLLCILSDTSSLAIKVVDKIEGGSEELSTLSEVLPQGFISACCATYEDNIYIFGGYNGSNYLNTIYKFNCLNKTIETLSVTLPQVLGRACCSINGDNIYIFGGFGTSRLNTIYKFNCTNETITTLSVTLPQALEYACCANYENYIYIFGGIDNSSNFNTIYRFNCTYESITTLSVTLPTKLYSICCSIYKDNIYIFGGYNTNNNTASDTIHKFDCVNETITTLTTVLPQKLFYASCSIHNDNIYIFGGYNGSKVLNTIYKFNCNNESIITLSNTLPQKLYNLFCSTYNDNIYIFGGSSGGSNYSKAIYDFSLSFELTSNNVLIYNANSDYSFELVTDQVTIPIKNVYIGNSNNTAQLANAYLYDNSQSAWVNVNTGEVLTL